jgi:hypothetical protein
MSANNPNSLLLPRDEWQDRMAVHNGITGVDGDNLKQPFGIAEIENDKDFHKSLLAAVSEEDPAALNYFAYAEAAFGELKPKHVEELRKDETTLDYIEARRANVDHAKLVEVWPEFVERYEAGQAAGIEQGYIPAVAAERFAKSQKLTSVRLADAAVLNVNGADADYDMERHQVRLNDVRNKTKEQIVLNLAHEFVHDDSGGTYLPKAATDENTIHEGPIPGVQSFPGVDSIRSRTGYSNGLDIDKMTKPGLVEAVTQHIALGILDGDFETFDPMQRQDGDRTYMQRRQVYAASVLNSEGIVQVKHLSNGIYEDTGPGGSFTDRRTMVRAYVDAYGWGAVRKLEKLCVMAEKMDSDPTGIVTEKLILSRIHPPMVDVNGVVIKRGYIDVESPLGSLDEDDAAKIKALEDAMQTGTPFEFGAGYSGSPEDTAPRPDEGLLNHGFIINQK